jgi:hypothetical protein
VPTFFTVHLNTSRTILQGQPHDWQLAEAKRSVKMFVLPHEHALPMSDGDVPDDLVSDQMAERYIALFPPIAAVIPEFQTIVNEIERSYVVGLFFSALSASCVAVERMLNMARIELHQYHPKIKELWGKGASNSWEENISALRQWGYLDELFARELTDLYQNVRCCYLHSGPIGDMAVDALRAATAAYKLLGIFLGFPPDLFRFTSQIECLNTSDPRFVAFYKPHLHVEPDPPGSG